MILHRMWPAAALTALLTFAGVGPATTHCDGLDGPVVNAAREALKTGDVDRVLIWVRAQDESQIRATFRQTIAVRKKAPEARELADMHFFETLVRIHRAGEGAAYTGLKPAGRDLGPAIPAADKAIADGSPQNLIRLLTHDLQQGVQAHYADLKKKSHFAPHDIVRGRAYVESYVAYIHYVERLHEATMTASSGHYEESASAGSVPAQD